MNVHTQTHIRTTEAHIDQVGGTLTFEGRNWKQQLKLLGKPWIWLEWKQTNGTVWCCHHEITWVSCCVLQQQVPCAIRCDLQYLPVYWDKQWWVNVRGWFENNPDNYLNQCQVNLNGPANIQMPCPVVLLHNLQWNQRESGENSV